jgi:hypothetical protein
MTTRYRTTAGLSGWLIIAGLVLVAILPLLAAPAHAANSSPPLTGGITGPSTLGTGLKATYVVTAQGGPAESTSGTQVGTYTFKASMSAVNTTNATLSQTSGVLVNGTVSLVLKAPNVAEPFTIYVLVTSTLSADNASQNFSYSLQIVEPYTVRANLVVGAGSGVSPFTLTVALDGQPVGSILVPSLSAGTAYPVSFSYVPPGLTPGWHTFSLSLAQEHGLVVFAGGSQVYSSSFYVVGPNPDYSLWYLTGVSAFVGAIVIWSTRVGGPRRGRSKK